MPIYIYRYEVRPPPEIDFFVSINGCVHPQPPSGFAACASLIFVLQTGDTFPTREQVEAVWRITGIWEDEFTYIDTHDQTPGPRRFRRRERPDDN